jgi:hypothetical protein
VYCGKLAADALPGADERRDDPVDDDARSAPRTAV